MNITMGRMDCQSYRVRSWELRHCRWRGMGEHRPGGLSRTLGVTGHLTLSVVSGHERHLDLGSKPERQD